MEINVLDHIVLDPQEEKVLDPGHVLDTRDAQSTGGPSTAASNLFIAIGLEEEDPGYGLVTGSFEALGSCTPLTDSLWHLSSEQSIGRIFKRINMSMMDTRIGSGSGLLVLDADQGRAKWFFSRPISDILSAYWHQRNNLLVSFKLHDPKVNYMDIFQDIRALGAWTPISQHLWYVNSDYSSKEAFQILMGRMDRGDELCVLDAHGNMATWQDRSGEIALYARQGAMARPKHARIHVSEHAAAMLRPAA